MWLHISVVGKVEHTSLVHGQTKVINKLVHQFAFFYNCPPRNVGDNLKWKKSERSSWRRKCGSQSCAVSRPTTPDNISLSTSTVTLRNLSSLSASRSNFRWSYFGGKENTRGGGRGGGLMTRDNANYYSDYQERVMSLLTVRWTQLISPIQNILPQPPLPPAPPARPQWSRAAACSPTSSLT